MESNMDNAQTQCTRCGTCCEKGGPALHAEDLDLVMQKKIPAQDLYTIRRGETVHDNVSGELINTPQEIIKLKPAEHSAACIYYDAGQKACRIYDIRPLECRLMACWDTGPLEAAYEADRLDRDSVFGNLEWLMDLIRTHEEKCGYEMIAALAEKRQFKDAGAGEDILEAVRYDAEMRRVVREKAGMGEGMLELIFGRPLEKTIPVQFGIKLVRNS
ncbi:MAG: YkgJ family cysteine cluster protein [Desulfobacteraceae bacterium]|nr:YkgJ family cysteine cluster protein [Desulfobacteraceae bacterium]